MSNFEDLRNREGKKETQQKEKNKNANKYPKHLIVLGCIGAVLLVVGIILLIVALTKRVPDMGEDDWFDKQSGKMFTCFCGGALMLIGLVLSFMALMPMFAKLNIKTTKYVANENKGDLTDIADTTGEIVGGATKTLARKCADAFNEAEVENKNSTSGAKGTERKNVAEENAQDADEEPAREGKFCENCGQPISARAKFCKHCGARRG